MKMLMAAATLVFATIAVPAFADTTMAGAGASSSSVSGAQAQSGVAVNRTENLQGQQASQAITFNPASLPTSTEMTVRSAPEVVAPALTTTLTETCMGSSSGGVSGVAFGISVGSTWTDKDCQNRLNARQLAAMGYRAAARVVMCANPIVRQAFKDTGLPCPGDQATTVSQNSTTANKVASSSEAAPELVATDSQGRTWKRANEHSDWVLEK